ncbi:MAG TPA: hypothetical protein VNN22_07635 [Verrucomicrobiae bacterium]|nr:hypothetical protein [Verrucomicrobiae bacterium]
MKIPKFRRSRSLICESEVCCLKASAPNSAIPNLAAKHIAKFADDPEFNIYLRAKNPAKVTKWQQQMLNQLFEKGELAVAIEAGMKDYEKDLDYDYRADYEKKAWDDIRLNGVLPHVTLLHVVIDDMKREVILSLSTESDGNLEEHGIVIYLKDGAWTFDSDHLTDYLTEVEDEELERGEIDFEEDEEEAKLVEPNCFADISFIVGTWEYDAEADKEWMKANGDGSDDEIELHIKWSEYEGRRFELSEKRMLYWYKYSTWRKPDEWEILRYEKHEKKISIIFQEQKDRDNKWEFFYENDRLRSPHGGIFKRKQEF